MLTKTGTKPDYKSIAANDDSIYNPSVYLPGQTVFPAVKEIVEGQNIVALKNKCQTLKIELSNLVDQLCETDHYESARNSAINLKTLYYVIQAMLNLKSINDNLGSINISRTKKLKYERIRVSIRTRIDNGNNRFNTYGEELFVDQIPKIDWSQFPYSKDNNDHN